MNEIIKQTPNETAIVKALEAEGITDAYVISQLKDLVENAVTQNNKWDLIKDYPTILKTLQTILKIKDKRFDNWGINLNFFQAPDVRDLKF